MKNLFQSAKPTINLSGKKCWNFSLTGNGKFTTGWKKSTISDFNQKRIIKMIEDGKQVYKRGGKYFALSINGVESPILGTKGGLKQL